ncbi:MAG: Asp-tRNA(Asn)/Glu-tRNA(Gln) amidotransferase GatCAB subunit B, partial [Chloroflexota bacterium]|nr:Asp-tRNA(Asn)/Glu-tRNA(Gln) amidotransferase GatCAB subunit B [Chloroflexota bacterium]
ETLAKVEVKNMNSFRAVYRALEYEAGRQRRVTREGKRLTQETRGWVEEKGKTVSQRSKEYAHDYRYFPEPDLPPLVLSREWVEEVRARLPELPEARRDRFVAEYKLSVYDANLVTASRAAADYFEACLEVGLPEGRSLSRRAKMVSNWLSGEFSRLLNATGTEIADSRVSPEHLCQLLDLVHKGSISGTSAKAVFEEMFSTGESAADIVTRRGLRQISGSGEIEEKVIEIINSNGPAVADYKAGKAQALKFLVGQVMRATGGRANPGLVNELMEKRLKEG